jgi:hypothetical protein
MGIHWQRTIPDDPWQRRTHCSGGPLSRPRWRTLLSQLVDPRSHYSSGPFRTLVLLPQLELLDVALLPLEITELLGRQVQEDLLCVETILD